MKIANLLVQIHVCYWLTCYQLIVSSCDDRTYYLDYLKYASNVLPNQQKIMQVTDSIKGK